MALDSSRKQQVIAEARRSERDTGSPEVQVAVLNERIADLTEHFKIHKRDFSSRRGLLKLVNRRRRLLDYLKRKDPKRHRELLARLAEKKRGNA